MTRLRLLRTALPAATLLAACAGAAGDDGPAPTKTDAHHDGSDTFEPLDDTAIDDDTGTTFDDTSTPLDSTGDDTRTGADSSLTCSLDEYDVNGNAADGCEVIEVDDDHAFSSPFSFGSVSECDSGVGS